MIAQPGCLLLVWLVALAALAGLAACSAQGPSSQTSNWPSGRPLPRLVIIDRTTTPLMKAEKPWEDFCLGFIRVLRVGDIWHMWYNGYDHTYQNDQDVTLCYARSADGVRWERPNLGMVEHNGSKDSNILAKRVCGPGVFLDDGAPPAERFKIVHIRFVDNSSWNIYGGTSPDGIHWKWVEQPLLNRNADTDNVCFRDGDVYRMYVRMWSRPNFGGYRMVGCTESKTFAAFPDPVAILRSDKDDPKDMHFYNSAATKLVDGLYVMFPSAFYTDSQTVFPHAALSRDGKAFQRVGRHPILKGNVAHDANRPDRVRYDGGIGRFRLRIEGL